jgi:15-cis-phytoene desaturase
LLERLGTRERIAWHADKVITLATQPRTTEMRHGALPVPFSLLPAFLRMPGVGWRDVLSNWRPSWRALQFDEEDLATLDAVPALAYLRSAGTSEAMIDRFWRFAAMTVMNVPLEHCSTGALLRVHSQLIGHRGIHFGFPAIALAGLYAEQAIAAIEAAGGRVLTGAQVAATQHAAGEHVAVLADGGRVGAAHCVFALPPAELASLRPELVPAPFEPSPYVSVYLWLDRKVTRERFWALPWSQKRLNYDFYDLSNIREGWRARPSVIASNIIHSHGCGAIDDAGLVAATVRELAEFVPEAAQARVTHAAVHRIPMAICCPTPGSESRRPSTRTAIRGVFLAGDWTRTRLPSSMESATRSGFLAAEAVLADLGREEAIAIAPRPNDGLARLIHRLR